MEKTCTEQVPSVSTRRFQRFLVVNHGTLTMSV